MEPTIDLASCLADIPPDRKINHGAKGTRRLAASGEDCEWSRPEVDEGLGAASR